MINVSKIKTVRQQLKMTQAQVADHCRVDTNTYKDWEAGRSSPNTLETWRNLAKTLGVTMDWLVGCEVLDVKRSDNV